MPSLTTYEKATRKKGYQILAGIDEAGRGPLAGPVVAAACIIPEKVVIRGIDDSKKLTPEKREKLFDKICSNPDIIYGVGIISHEVIDQVNIYQASILAMLEAVSKLSVTPDILLVDGLKLPHPSIPSEKIIDGDALVRCIAAASILAKVTRDRIMVEYHQQFPQYGFDQHKGYCTAQHLVFLEKYGACPIHRRSFEPVTALKTEAHVAT